MPNILHDPVDCSGVPSNINNFDNFDVPTVANTLGKPIHSRIFRFNKFVSNLDIGFYKTIISSHVIMTDVNLLTNILIMF